MNDWNQEELDKLEREAARFDGIEAMKNFLHIATGLSYSVCKAWAVDIVAKRDREGD